MPLNYIIHYFVLFCSIATLQREAKETRKKEKKQNIFVSNSCENISNHNLLHRYCIVEKYKCCNLVTIQASLMNFITFDYNQWEACSCIIA